MRSDPTPLLLAAAILATLCCGIPAQALEQLDRGVVAMATTGGNVYVGWRLLASDPADIGFDVFRSAEPGGERQKLNAGPVHDSCNFVDTGAGGKSWHYVVRPVGAAANISMYDELNRVRTVTDPAAKTITYAYDPVGRRDHMIDPDGGRFTYAYDAAGRSEWLVNPHDERTTFAYNDAGELELQTLGNASRTSYSYDAGGRVEAVLNATSTGTILSSFDYAYDNVGNRTGVVEADGSRVTWSYDDDYRLRSEHRTDNLAWESMTVDQWDRMTVDEWDAMEVSGAGGGYRITHTYDPVGNRLVQNDSGTRTTYAYDAARCRNALLAGFGLARLGSEILGSGGRIADDLGNLAFLERNLPWEWTPETRWRNQCCRRKHGRSLTNWWPCSRRKGTAPTDRQ